jgi:hypothetical protein
MSFVTWNLSKVINAFGKLFTITDINISNISQQKYEIHEQRESATFSSPRNLDLFHCAIFSFKIR